MPALGLWINHRKTGGSRPEPGAWARPGRAGGHRAPALKGACTSGVPRPSRTSGCVRLCWCQSVTFQKLWWGGPSQLAGGGAGPGLKAALSGS